MKRFLFIWIVATTSLIVSACTAPKGETSQQAPNGSGSGGGGGSPSHVQGSAGGSAPTPQLTGFVEDHSVPSLGAALRDARGVIWSTHLNGTLGKRTNFSSASEDCKKLGARLPSAYEVFSARLDAKGAKGDFQFLNKSIWLAQHPGATAPGETASPDMTYVSSPRIMAWSPQDLRNGTEIADGQFDQVEYVCVAGTVAQIPSSLVGTKVYFANDQHVATALRVQFDDRVRGWSFSDGKRWTDFIGFAEHVNIEY